MVYHLNGSPEIFFGSDRFELLAHCIGEETESFMFNNRPVSSRGVAVGDPLPRLIWFCLFRGEVVGTSAQHLGCQTVTRRRNDVNGNLWPLNANCCATCNRAAFAMFQKCSRKDLKYCWTGNIVPITLILNEYLACLISEPCSQLYIA